MCESGTQKDLKTGKCDDTIQDCVHNAAITLLSLFPGDDRGYCKYLLVVLTNVQTCGVCVCLWL